MSSHEDPCTHEGWECRGGWHKCNDCGRGLGTRYNPLEDHKANECSLCGPSAPVVLDPARVMPQGPSAKFVTKDSGKRQDYASGMRRDVQENKPRFDLLLVEGLPYEEQFLTRWAALLERGATKYGNRNWEQANSQEELDRFKASAFRHFMQWYTGEVDEDHSVACCFNLMAAEYVKRRLENDVQDRDRGVS